MSSEERASSAPLPRVPSEDAADAEGSAPRSVGQYLAKQRRLRRISLEELSERTRIPRRNLEHLESGAFDAKDDGFTRGFVRTVAEALGLDAAEAVMRLVGEPRAEEDRALRAARRATRWRVAGLVLGVALVLVAAGLCAGREPQEAEPEAPAVTYRRDAVRGLVEDSGPQPPEPGRPPQDPR